MSLKDRITNIVAFISGAMALVQLITEAWTKWLTTAPPDPKGFDWVQLAILIGITVVGYFTGKPVEKKIS